MLNSFCRVADKTFFWGLLGLLLLQLAGCATTHHHHRYSADNDYAPDYSLDASKIQDAVPQDEPRSKYGNPASYVACGHRYYVMKSSSGYHERGIASWYGMKFHKFRTSSGEPYDVNKMTAANKTLPLPTYVLVTNLQNGKHAIVKVNDRGPFVSNRIIDLSYAAAVKLGVFAHGTALVDVKAIDPRHPQTVLKQSSPITSIPGHPLIYLQIGAFSSAANAQNLVPKVKQWTQEPVSVRKTMTNGRTLYRVVIGPMPGVENTDSLYEHLEGLGLGKPKTAIM